MLNIRSWSIIHTLVVVAALIIIAGFVRGILHTVLWWTAVAVLALHALAETGR